MSQPSHNPFATSELEACLEAYPGMLCAPILICHHCLYVDSSHKAKHDHHALYICIRGIRWCMKTYTNLLTVLRWIHRLTRNMHYCVDLSLTGFYSLILALQGRYACGEKCRKGKKLVCKIPLDKSMNQQGALIDSLL